MDQYLYHFEWVIHIHLFTSYFGCEPKRGTIGLDTLPFQHLPNGGRPHVELGGSSETLGLADGRLEPRSWPVGSSIYPHSKRSWAERIANMNDK